MTAEFRIFDDIKFMIDPDAFVAEMRLKPGTRRDANCRELVRRVNETARPKTGFLECVVEDLDETGMTLNGVRFTSTLFVDRLQPGQKLYPFLSTCGKEIGTFDQQFLGDVLQQYWADCLMEKTLRYASAALEQQLAPLISDEFLACFNPGSLPVWPLLEQRPMFQLLGEIVPALDVALTEHCLMLPQKTVSGFYFSATTEYHNCELCPRLRCPTRTAEFIGR